MIPKLYTVTAGLRAVMTFDEDVAKKFARDYFKTSEVDIKEASTWDEMKLEMGSLTPEQNETLLMERTLYYTTLPQGTM